MGIEIYKVEPRRMPRYSRMSYHQKGPRTGFFIKPRESEHEFEAIDREEFGPLRGKGDAHEPFDDPVAKDAQFLPDDLAHNVSEGLSVLLLNLGVDETPAGSVAHLGKREPLFRSELLQPLAYSGLVMHGAVNKFCPPRFRLLLPNSFGVQSPRPLIISKRGRLTSTWGAFAKCPLSCRTSA